MKYNIVEDSRQDLVRKSKNSTKGKQRFNRRVKSKIANSVKQYNEIDMNKLFVDDILTIDINIQGETDNYSVRISFGDFCELLHDQIFKNNSDNPEVTLRAIIQCLVIGFNRADVLIGCSCPDFYYRFGYWATRNKIVSNGNEQNIPSDKTNPNDTLGAGCKHILLVLNNTTWIIKVASVINNYIKYMQDHYEKLYAKVIYPAIYKQEYKDEYQLTLDDTNKLDTDKDTIDRSNIHASKRGQFQAGNEFRFRKTDNPDENQLDLFDND